jgi:hypothetical protein
MTVEITLDSKERFAFNKNGSHFLQRLEKLKTCVSGLVCNKIVFVKK